MTDPEEIYLDLINHLASQGIVARGAADECLAEAAREITKDQS